MTPSQSSRKKEETLSEGTPKSWSTVAKSPDLAHTTSKMQSSSMAANRNPLTDLVPESI
jgi:hypothetical protein